MSHLSTEKIFHTEAEWATRHWWLGYFVLPFMLFGGFFLIYHSGIFGGKQFDVGDFIIGVLSVLLWTWVGVMVFTRYFIYIFNESGELQIENYRRKHVATYQPSDIATLAFHREITEAQAVEGLWPNLIMRMKDGRKFKFDCKMENYSLLVDTLEEWANFKIPNKEASMKNRGNDCLWPNQMM